MLASTKNVLADPSLCHSIMTGMKDFWEQVAKQNPSTGVTRWRETGPSEQIVLYSKKILRLKQVNSLLKIHQARKGPHYLCTDGLLRFQNLQKWWILTWSIQPG